jgi:hypothetical protein
MIPGIIGKYKKKEKKEKKKKKEGVSSSLYTQMY